MAVTAGSEPPVEAGTGQLLAHLRSVLPGLAGALRQVGNVMARDDGSSGLRARLEDPLETLLTQESLSRLGAVMAVDGDGVLRGIVTIEAVRRALRAVAPA